jgi:hypothetical protein
MKARGQCNRRSKGRREKMEERIEGKLEKWKKEGGRRRCGVTFVA